MYIFYWQKILVFTLPKISTNDKWLISRIFYYLHLFYFIILFIYSFCIL